MLSNGVLSSSRPNLALAREILTGSMQEWVSGVQVNVNVSVDVQVRVREDEHAHECEAAALEWGGARICIDARTTAASTSLPVHAGWKRDSLPIPPFLISANSFLFLTFSAMFSLRIG